jgi:subfamily B ATP-binding cassette protein MsbA
MAFRLPFTKLAADGSLALIRRLLGETGREFAGRYAVVIGLSIVIAASTALNAWLIKDIIDQVFFDKSAAALYLLTAVIVVNGFVRGFSLYGQAVTLGRIGNAVVARTQRRLFDHMLNLGVAFYTRTPSSELMTRLSHNAQAARDVLNTFVNGVGRDLLTVVALVIVMFIQSPAMSLLALVGGPIAGFAIAGLVRRVRGVARAQFDSLSMVVSDMQETALGIRIVKAFNLEPLMRKRMDKSIGDVQSRSDKIVRIQARSNPLMEVIAGFAIAMIVLWAGYQIIYQDVQPGALMSFIAALALAYEPAKRLAQMQIRLETGLVGVRMMYELLDTAPDFAPNTTGPTLAIAKGEVVFDKVDFAYSGEPPLFRGFNFRAAGGKTTALVGPSGGGKSTIMSLIERFYAVDNGRVLIDGQDIAGVKTASLREAIALVTQDTYLFRDTIRENIRFGRLDATDAEVEKAAKDAMAHDFIVATAKGYDTVLGDLAAQLSGGQRQRLTIARAILRNAPIILLDEATSSLDSESEHQIQLALDHLMQGRTTIVIAHRLSTVLHADKICVLVNGTVVEEGRHDELLARGGHYARLYRLQFRDPAAGDRAPMAVPAE